MSRVVPRPAPTWPLPRVFAHRCGGALAPENTLSGLRIAAAMRIKAVEFDVMLSADGSPWLIHDETLDRTTSGTGDVFATPDEVLRELDAGVKHHRAYIGEVLPTFDVAVLLCRELGLQVNVEIKPAAGFEAETAEVVTQRILDLWQNDPLPLVSSFSEEALAVARRVSPEVPLGYLCVSPPDDWFQRMEALGAFSLHCAANRVDNLLLDTARGKAIPVLCWTVNDRPSAERLLERGVTSVFSDRIDLLANL